jgi:hypothetical protein
LAIEAGGHRALTPAAVFERLPAVTTMAIGVHRYPVIDGYVLPGARSGPISFTSEAP